MTPFAHTTEEQIRNLEAMAEQLRGLLGPLYEKRIIETRILSNDDRQEVLDELIQGVEPDKADSYERYTDTTFLSRGWHDHTDEELLRMWFEHAGYDEDYIMKLKLWRDKLSNNLGVIGVFGDWLNEKKRTMHE